MRELDFFWQNSLPVGFPLRNEKKVCTWFRGFFFDQIALCVFSINDQIKSVLCLKKAAEGKTHLQSENKVHQQPWLGLDCVIGGCQ